MFCFFKVNVFISVVISGVDTTDEDSSIAALLLVCFNGALNLLLQLLLEKSCSVAACGWDALS